MQDREKLCYVDARTGALPEEIKMRKKLIFLFGVITILSSLSAKEIQIKNLEDGSYSIKGKYRTYTSESKEFLEALRNNTAVLNAKYDFVATIIPNFVFVKIGEKDEYYNSIDSASLRYYVFKKEFNDFSIQTVYYLRVKLDDRYWSRTIDKTYFTMEEWNSFLRFLSEISDKGILLSPEAKEYMNENNITSVSEWIAYNEKIEKEEETKRAAIKAQKEKERLENLRIEKSKNYSFEDLVNYMTRMPDSVLPLPDTEFTVQGGAFGIESANIDGDGVDYLVSYAGNYGLIYIYGENLKTMPTHFVDGMGFKNGITFQNGYITLKYTGMSAPAISQYGNRIEVPIFIAK